MRANNKIGIEDKEDKELIGFINEVQGLLEPTSNDSARVNDEEHDRSDI